MHRDFVIDFASGDMNERMGKRTLLRIYLAWFNTTSKFWIDVWRREKEFVVDHKIKLATTTNITDVSTNEK